MLNLSLKLCIILTVSAGEALECWACSYENEKKACKGEDIEKKTQNPDI